MEQINPILILTIFSGGILSFFSPCILPIIPGYISYFSGLSIEEIEGGKPYRLRSLISSVFFVLGFTITFAILGATVGFIGAITNIKVDIVRRIGGIIVFILGLHQLGIVNIRLLNFHKSISSNRNTPGLISSFFMGVAFSIGWAPCTGPILGGVVLTTMMLTDNITTGIILLAIYSIGLGIPFIITSFSLNFLINKGNRIYKYFGIIKIVGGVVLLIMGILIFTNNITWIALRLSSF